MGSSISREGDDISIRGRPKQQYLLQNQTTYEEKPQIHHVRINSQNHLLLFGYTNHQTPNLLFSSHIYLIKKVLFLYDHFLILSDNGSVWSCGDNTNGKIGQGDISRHDALVKLQVDIVRDIKSNGLICFLLLHNGSVCAFGKNDFFNYLPDVFSTPTVIHCLQNAVDIVLNRQNIVVTFKNKAEVYKVHNTSKPLNLAHHTIAASLEKWNIVSQIDKRTILIAQQDDFFHDVFSLQLPGLIKSINSCDECTFCLLEKFDENNSNVYISGQENNDLSGIGKMKIQPTRTISPLSSLKGKYVHKIESGIRHVLFLVKEGKEDIVYCAGSNECKQLGTSAPSYSDEVVELKWRNSLSDDMSYLSTWKIESVGCHGSNTFIWLTNEGYDFYSLLLKNEQYHDISITTFVGSLH
ncbi:hypothetical protein AKO1_002317 [Acrasis kona]|uniref:Uncharacterized protein n=1 Tax=Acrasis kona TaxID=1008807 RepID=A0AAW2ZR84_9EUKA